MALCSSPQSGTTAHGSPPGKSARRGLRLPQLRQAASACRGRGARFNSSCNSMCSSMTEAPTHTHTQTHRHTDTQTHRHTDTHTHIHSDTQTNTDKHRDRHRQTQTVFAVWHCAHRRIAALSFASESAGQKCSPWPPLAAVAVAAVAAPASTAVVTACAAA
jgi:hypothetical protein